MKPSYWDWGLSEENPFFIRLHTYPPGLKQNTAPDFHEAIHLNVVVEGDARYSGRTSGSPRASITAPWEPHGGKMHTENGFVYCMSVTSPALLKKVLLGYGDNFFAFLSHSRGERDRIMEEYGLYSHCSVFADKIRKYGTEDILYCWKAALDCFMDIAHDLPELETKKPEQNSFLRLLPALKMVGSGKQVTGAEEAAESCNMSISRFRTLFKEVFQISFATYELKHRLNGAAEDILYGRLTVKDAAWQWGFFDTSHFSRLFKQYFSCTPGKYRENFLRENK